METTERFRGTWKEFNVRGVGGARLLRLADELGVPSERIISAGDGIFFRGDFWLELVLPEQYKEWRAASRLAVQDGQLVVAELRVFPAEEAYPTPGVWSAEVLGVAAPVPLGGLPGRLLRRVRLGQPAKHTERFLRMSKSKPLGQFFRELDLRAPAERSEPSRPQRPRRGRPDLFYARLAAAYVKAVQRGEQRPIRWLATQRRTEPATIRDMVHEARERGLLTPATQGKSGGALTPRALAMLGRRPNARPRRKR